MTGIYFSGTGNTKYCVTKFTRAINENAEVFSIEDDRAVKAITDSNFIVFGYPVYYSDIPKLVREFICKNSSVFKGKKIFIIATMGLFSGDGAGCSARLFKKYGAQVLGGLHIKMPDCIGDVKLLKKSLDKNRKIIIKADKKISCTAEKIQKNSYPQNGLSFLCRIAGLFGQRLYFHNKVKAYYKAIKLNKDKCVGCGICEKNCPMHNIDIVDGKAKFKDKCTICYRCFSKCPQQSITILGNKVFEQCYVEKYL